jgi:hypothetical protein
MAKDKAKPATKDKKKKAPPGKAKRPQKGIPRGSGGVCP